jgi:Peptidase family M28/PA domain
MPKRKTGQRTHWWIMLLCIGVAMVLTAPMSADATATQRCDVQANNTPSKLVACVQKADLMNHLQAFQDIADANPGPDGHASRNSGEPGYLASVNYVANLMKEAGYDVTIQTYKFDYFAYQGVPSFREVSPVAHDYVLTEEWGPGKSMGVSTAALQPAGGIVNPPAPTSSSTSGCTPTDFNGFVSGRIALIQRGGCNFGVKVLNAQAAGASGVIIFNEGNPGRTGLALGNLIDAAGNPIIPTIPVAFTTFAIGLDLYTQYQQAISGGTPLPTINLSVQGISRPNADDYNVIADSKSGDPNHVLVVDAHLDAIYGAGMLDNATGSAAILDIAQEMKNVHPKNKVRFIWFGGEELGLFGSKAYVNSLSTTDLSKIGYDLDADVFGTPNYTIGILDPAAPDFFSRTVSTTFPDNVYQPSTIARDQAIAFFDAAGVNHMLFSPVGTDAISFNNVGIPASGLLTGQDCCKTQEEVDLFGGYTGNYDGTIPSTDGGCVDLPFRWCDNIDNVDPNNFELMSKAFADMVIRMAMDANFTASGASRHKPVPGGDARGGATTN